MICGIYKITNTLNTHSYIGQSIDIEKRWKYHKNSNNWTKGPNKKKALYLAFLKYGLEHFSFEILEKCPKDLLNSREMFYIEKFDTFHNGYNMTIGGDGYRGVGRKINQYDLEGNYIKTWESIVDAEHKYGNNNSAIHAACIGKNKTAYNFQWRYFGDKPPEKLVYDCFIPVTAYDLNGDFIKDFPSEVEAAEFAKVSKATISFCLCGNGRSAGGYQWTRKGDNSPGRYKKCDTLSVIQYNLEGVFLNKFSSVQEASEFSGVSKAMIYESCRKSTDRGGNYLWRWEKDSPPKKYYHRCMKLVNQYDLEGNFIKQYESINEAGRSVSKNGGSNIYYCCQGKRKTAYGYVWKYAE